MVPAQQITAQSPDASSILGQFPRGYTVWFTGLPSSGKSTLANLLHTYLVEHSQRSVILDGDEVRDRLSRGLGFSREDRLENISRIAYVCRMVTLVGGVAIAAAISPHREARDAARDYIGNFVEVHVKCDLEVCVQRDVKGLYKRALQGEISNFTGISDPYEEPLNPEVVLETDRQSTEESLDILVSKLMELGYLVA